MEKQSSKGAVRALLISTSVIALAGTWGLASSPALAQGTEVSDTTVAGVAIGPAQSTDFILISNSTVTTNGVVNQGSIGTANPNATGILVTNDSTVNGGINNSGSLEAINEGIDIDFSTVNGNIVNAGNIDVGAPVAGTAVFNATGVRVSSTDVDAVINNSGEIDVAASATGADTEGDVEVSAFGVRINSQGNLDATVNNSGTLNVSASATDADDTEAEAVGISAELNESEGPQAVNATSTVTNSSASTIDVSAVAAATSSFVGATANAIAAGIRQMSEGTPTSNFSASNSGSLLVDAMATANANSANAFATSKGVGILQSVEDGTASGSSILTATNSALIDVSSIASAAITTFAQSGLADAEAVGIAQDANFPGDATSTATNSGTIAVDSSATISAPSANATADSESQGIRQFAVGGEGGLDAAVLTATNSGNIDASALASAQGRFIGEARADAIGILQDAQGATSVDFSIVNGGNIAAMATADASVSFSFTTDIASAFAAGIEQESFAFNTTDVTVSSSGTITASASAGLDEAIDTQNARAEAFGVRQMASGGGAIEVTTNVTGDIDATAMTMATGTAESFATARSRAAGIDQTGQSFDDSIQFTATTDGNTNVTAVANAEGSSGASAAASATGIAQTAFGDTSAAAAASNNGTMTISSSATADGGFGASEAFAFGAGILQNRSDGFSGSGEGQGFLIAPLGITNTSFSTIDVTVTANAIGSGTGTATAQGLGISQDISRSADAPANADNSGGIDVSTVATASNSDDFVFAGANASSQGIFQSVFSGSGNASGNISSGIMTVSAVANATATGASSTGNASAFSAGLDQNLNAFGTTSSNVTTSISLAVSAIADAASSSSPTASATAFGSRQMLSQSGAATANYTNSGNVAVTASAAADGAFSSAIANAAGAYIESFSGSLLTVNANSTGNMTVTATADGSGFESANAAGIQVSAISLAGTVANNGTMTVHAEAPEGVADAHGILVQTDSFTGTIGNYGTMTVTAVEGIPGTAYGLVIESIEAPSGTSGTVENDGLLTAEVAISTLNAPGPSQINQLGGMIVGDLWLSSGYGDTVEFTEGTIQGDTFGSGNDDTFNFRSGSGSGAPTVTYIGALDGLSAINVHPGMAYLDGTVTSTAAFNLLSGGALTLSSNGPTQVNVDSYTQVSGSLLIYEITPDPASAAQINGGSVSLDGAVTVAPLPGFYPNAITYEEVVVSGGPTGQWTTVIDTALLDVEAVYQGDNTVDLMVTRIPFDQVEGLNENQQNVGGGLEEIYEDSEGTPIGETIEELFLLDPEAYAEVLTSLSGAEFAQGLQSLLEAGGPFQNAVLGHLGHGNGGQGNGQSAGLGRFEFLSSQMAAAGTDESGGSAPAAQRQQLAAAEARDREAGSVGIWARAYGNFGDNDGDENAVGYEVDQYGFAAGADVAVVEDLVLGLAGGYSESDLDFDNDNKIDYDGFQVAAYGSFSPGAWYLDGMVAYAWYDNDSRRATIGGTARADYDSEVFTAYAETGYGFDLSPVTVTPFAGLGYAHADTDSFDESGAGPFSLSVDSSDAESLTTTLGVEVDARLKVSWETFVMPRLRLGWEHEFEDDQQSVGASFVGAPASGFTVLSSQVADDSALVGAGVTVEMGQTWQLFLDYDGKLNEDYSQHAVSGGLKVIW